MDMYCGMKIIHDSSYDCVYLPNHPAAHQNGIVAIHILQVEKKLGRYLSKEECVHHIDFNKRNNDMSNLMVFASNSMHTLYHSCLKYGYDYQLTCIGGVFSCKRLSGPIYRTTCIICGKSIKHGGNYCWTCYTDKVHHERNIPEKEALIKELSDCPNFVKVAKNHGVTDSAVRKWCRRYNLPSHTSDWKNYNRQLNKDVAKNDDT